MFGIAHAGVAARAHQQSTEEEEQSAADPQGRLRQTKTRRRERSESTTWKASDLRFGNTATQADDPMQQGSKTQVKEPTKRKRKAKHLECIRLAFGQHGVQHRLELRNVARQLQLQTERSQDSNMAT